MGGRGGGGSGGGGGAGALTEAEEKALDRYQGDASYNINRILREGGDIPPRYQSDIAGLDSIMARSRLPANTELYRDIPRVSPLFGDVSSRSNLAGFEWTDKAYVSTSLVARSPRNQAVMMRILAPRGTRAIRSGLLDTNEVLLGRGQRYRVVRDRGTHGGIRYIDVRVIR